MYISIVRFITPLGKSVNDTTSCGIDKIVDKITISLNMHVNVRIEKKKTFQLIYHLCYNSFVLFECFKTFLSFKCKNAHTNTVDHILFHMRHYILLKVRVFHF